VCGEGGGSDRGSGGDGRESERMAHEQRNDATRMVGWLGMDMVVTYEDHICVLGTTATVTAVAV